MPTVKRFRTLGQIPKKEPVVETTPSSLTPKRKNVKRFRPRATRSDRRHRFTLRISKQPWDQVKELSINCGGSETGASLNNIVNDLIGHALDSIEICESIRRKYPQAQQIIKIRTWG